nr:uncharacterized protein LOC129143119 [Pan troglodytes]
MRVNRAQGDCDPEAPVTEGTCCCHQEMYTDLQGMKWAKNWMLEPLGFLAYKCVGTCQQPLEALAFNWPFLGPRQCIASETASLPMIVSIKEGAPGAGRARTPRTQTRFGLRAGSAAGVGGGPGRQGVGAAVGPQGCRGTCSWSAPSSCPGQETARAAYWGKEPAGDRGLLAGNSASQTAGGRRREGGSRPRERTASPGLGELCFQGRGSLGGEMHLICHPSRNTDFHARPCEETTKQALSAAPHPLALVSGLKASPLLL